MLTFVAERVGKRAKLVAGTNSQRPADTVELSNFAKGLGYEALMLAAPFYSLPNTHELAQHYRHIAGSTGSALLAIVAARQP